MLSFAVQSGSGLESRLGSARCPSGRHQAKASPTMCMHLRILQPICKSGLWAQQLPMMVPLCTHETNKQHAGKVQHRSRKQKLRVEVRFRPMPTERGLRSLLNMRVPGGESWCTSADSRTDG